VLVTTDRDAAAERLNALLDRHAGRPRLVRHEGWDWHVHADVTDDAPWAAWLASSAALALATMLAGSASLPWGECRSDGCGRSFVHDGRGGERRYCSARCSTRERVRRHRLRERSGQLPHPRQ
jgi:predicted RNA-binding Zn ribbon-like protein